MYIYEVCFKNRVFFFFCKVIVGYKMKIKGVVEDLKIRKKLKNNSKNIKYISRTFSGVVGSVGQFIFG